MSNLTTAYIGLGSNSGDRGGFIQQALKLLNETDGIEVMRTSDVVETRPLAGKNQPDYLNTVAEIKTSRNAEKLYEKMTEIENALGRERNEKWASRTIDLDLLLFGSEIIKTEQLTIPHPQMHLRSFVLDGLFRLDAQLQHPLLKEAVTKLASRLNGQDFALRLDIPQLISIAGVIGVGKTTLAEKLSKFFNGKLLLEPYDTNPFMPDVYAGRKEVALDSQLYFLTNRTEQLNPDRLEVGKIAVSDYIFEKELIYAGLLLNEQQLTLYEKIYPYSARKIAEPVLVIYLTDSAQNCLRRIHERNRSYEQKIEPEFLEKLDSDYVRLFAGWKTSPIISVSMSKFDCTDRNDINRLTNQIKSYVVV